jgi:hypothetical protein
VNAGDNSLYMNGGRMQRKKTDGSAVTGSPRWLCSAWERMPGSVKEHLAQRPGGLYSLPHHCFPFAVCLASLEKEKNHVPEYIHDSRRLDRKSVV